MSAATQATARIFPIPIVAFDLVTVARLVCAIAFIAVDEAGVLKEYSLPYVVPTLFSATIL